MKFDTSKLRDQLKSEGKKGKKNDLRRLNYWDLGDGEKIVIRFLPATDDNDLWVSYETHNLDTPGVNAVRCVYEAKGENCPICNHSYGFHKAGDKEEARRWRSKETYLAQAVVIESDIEVQYPEDGNPIKLVFLPYKVKEHVKESILNGVIDNPSDHDFLLVRKKGKNGQWNYEASMFRGAPSDIPEKILEEIDEKGELYDLHEEEPPVSSVDECADWLQKAIESDENGGSSDRTTERTTTRRSADTQDDDTGSSGDDSDSKPDDSGDGKEEAPSRNDVRERLNRRRRQG